MSPLPRALAWAEGDGIYAGPNEAQRMESIDAEVLDILGADELTARQVAEQTVDYTDETSYSCYSRTYARLLKLERAGTVVSRMVDHAQNDKRRLWRKPDTEEGSTPADPIDELLEEWRIRAAARRAGGQNRSAGDIETCIEELEAIVRAR